jgi:intracellular septation protein
MACYGPVALILCCTPTTGYPMKFLYDFFPIVLFFISYKVYGMYVATAVIIVSSLLQVGYSWYRHRKVEKMHLITLVIVLVFGGLTLILQDPVFIKWKPTVVNGLFAVAFLGSQFIGKKTLVERMMSTQIELPSAVWRRLNLTWVAFFVVSGAANIYVAYNFSEDTWVNFKLFGVLGLTFAFIIIQAFYISRHLPDEALAEVEEALPESDSGDKREG